MNSHIGTQRGLDPQRVGAVRPGARRMLQRGEEPVVTVVPLASRDPERARRLKILCAACGHAITSGDARVTVGGAHVHTRTNPHGHAFTFGCFAGAPGCLGWGAASQQATWFPGYFWWIEVCGGCGEHLGWLFFAEGRGDFHGLVLDRLREAEG